MNPVVSIIVPVYNAKEYLRRCVDSILGQEYTDFELLLIDDGSQDGSGAICDEYAAKDMRVRVIHKENGGVSEARNLAMKNARGTYLQFADSDDWITPDATKLLVRMAEEDGCDLVISDFYRVAGERVSQKGDIEEDGCMTREQFAAHMMENPADFYYGVLWNKLYRRELFQEIRYPLGRIHEDEATTYRIYDQVKRAAYVDSSLYGYFVTPASITRGFNPKRMDWVYAVAERMDFFEKRGYRELMVPGLQAFADGSIDIYFGLRDHLPDSGRQQEEIRAFVRQGLKRVRRYGRFPLRTAIGYRLFLACPGIYRKLLNRVKSENGKQ